MATALPTLTRAAWFLCGDVHQASDLVQHALLRTYTAWPRSSRAPLAYARKVMTNKQVDTWHARRREVLVSPHDLPEHAVTDPAAAVAERDRLERALRRLGAQQRRVVVLRHVRGLSEKEVAELLDISVGTVKSTASRGLERLRGILGQEIPMNASRPEPPEVEIDTDQVIRRGHRRRAARAAAVVTTALALVVGVGAGVLALRDDHEHAPVSTTPARTSTPTPTPTATATPEPPAPETTAPTKNPDGASGCPVLPGGTGLCDGMWLSLGSGLGLVPSPDGTMNWVESDVTGHGTWKYVAADSQPGCPDNAPRYCQEGVLITFAPDSVPPSSSVTTMALNFGSTQDFGGSQDYVDALVDLHWRENNISYQLVPKMTP